MILNHFPKIHFIHSAEEVYVHTFNGERWLLYRLNLVYVYDFAFQVQAP